MYFIMQNSRSLKEAFDFFKDITTGLKQQINALETFEVRSGATDNCPSDHPQSKGKLS